MNFPCLARGLWQLEVLILILWLSPPLPLEQITAAIEFPPSPPATAAAISSFSCSRWTGFIQTGQRRSFTLLRLSDETDEPTHS